MGGAGGFSLVRFRWAWLVLAGFGWSWLLLAGFGWFWLLLAGFGVVVFVFYVIRSPFSARCFRGCGLCLCDSLAIFSSFFATLWFVFM